MSEHLDLDALADILADGPSGAGDPTDLGAPADLGRSPADRLAHLATCAGCAGRLAELEVAVGHVAGALASLPEPELPAGLAERLDAAMATQRARTATDGTAGRGTAGQGTATQGTATQAATSRPATADVVPLAGRRNGFARWLPIAGGIAAAAALVFGGVLLTQKSGTSGSTASKAAARPPVAVNSTGASYGKDGKALAAALPTLLKGSSTEAFATPADASGKTTQATPPLLSGGAAEPDNTVPSPSVGAPKATPQRSVATAQDALAALRGTAGLSACLSGLTDPGDPGVPLALDYASFDGKPAMVVILPSVKADKVDVYVVGAGCVAKDSQLLYFTRLRTPQP